MRTLHTLIWAVLLGAAPRAMNQAVTGSGSTNTVPIFTGSSTVGNSPISAVGSDVGIGTTNITSRLTLDTQAAPGIDIFRSDTDAQFSGIRFRSSGNSANHAQLGWNGDQLRIEGTNNINFVTSGSDGRLSILGNGNVGIGTTSPVALLDVYGAGNTSSIVPSIWIGGGSNYNAPNDTALNGMVGFRGSGWLDGFIAFYPHRTDGGAYFQLTGQSVSYGDYGAGLLVSGKVGIGTMSPQYSLDVVGQLHASSGIVYPDGSQQTTAWTGVLCGGDYAESVDVTGDRTKYGPGDVMVIDPEHDGKFLKSAEPYSTAVLGIYSTRPGALGRRQTSANSADEVPMAMIGIVPTKVSAENGAIKRGDLLVTSSTPGYAMKGTDRNRLVGAVIGKAMGNLNSGVGVIEVGVTLQ